MATIVPPFVAAVLIQPLVVLVRLSIMIVSAWMAGLSASASDIQGLGTISIYVLVVAAAFVLVLGLPLFLMLMRLNKLSWLSVTLAGVGAAAVPYALFSWPLWHDMSGFSSGGNWYGHYVEFIKDGVLTIYGWLSYVESTLWFSIHGLVGATVFYWIWIRLNGNPTIRSTGRAKSTRQ